MDKTSNTQQCLRGVLLGTAVGDALGLSAEGLSPQRIARKWGGSWKMRFFFGRGMVSDDTEHALMVAQSLLVHPGDSHAFQNALAWKLRWWFLGLPAGVGLATARACIKLWVGFRPTRSGVFSAGNGPAMRSAILGAHFADAPDKIEEFVRASTIMTHSDPKAVIGAMAIARVVAWAAVHPTATAPDLSELARILNGLSDDPEWTRIVASLLAAYQQQIPVEAFARGFGEKGVSGYIFHTVAVAIYAWLRYFRDFRGGLIAVLNCGGDTDTVGAIAGALLGASVGEQNIPTEWVNGICDFPCSPSFLRRVADLLAGQIMQPGTVSQVSCFWPATIIRNLFFLLIVLLHGFRRLLPPY